MVKSVGKLPHGVFESYRANGTVQAEGFDADRCIFFT